MKDYSWIKGVNHNWSTREQVIRELSFGKKVGLNATRIWLDMRLYERDPDGYLDRLEEYLDTCFECGYQVMPILFNGNGLDPSLLEEHRRNECEIYMSAVLNMARKKPGLFMWDIMNEPTCNDWIGNTDLDREERERRKEKLWVFIRSCAAFLKALDPEHPLTVGHTLAYDIEPTADCVDVFSFHDYSGTRKEMNSNYAFAADLSAKYVKPVLQTETGCLARCNPYDLALYMCSQYHIGWFIYELMIHDRCDSEHGVFYPDGTVRDPATVSAMMGIFRCRDLDIIIPGLPNREGQAERCIADLKKALKEYTSDAFDYRRSDVYELLEACERAANLLECCEAIPMIIPPSARVLALRKEKNPSVSEARRLAYELAKTLMDICEIL